MKIITGLLTIVLLLIDYSVNLRTCKTEILRAIGYHSKLTPGKKCSLCPYVSLNCCTNYDQMRMHKSWNTITIQNIIDRNNESLNALRNLSELFNIKDKWQLDKLTSAFVADKKPSSMYENHL